MTPKDALDWVENVFEEHHVQLPEVELALIRQALNELYELKRDVAKYFELEARFEAYKSGVKKPYGMTWNILYLNEMKRLKLKLSKVGKEE